MDRVQRVDQERGAREREAGIAAALAEAMQRFRLRRAGQACRDEPALDAVQCMHDNRDAPDAADGRDVRSTLADKYVTLGLPRAITT